MQHSSEDLRVEQGDLMALARTLTAQQWEQPGDFYGWSAWDEIAHLCFFDQSGLLAATDAAAFARDTRALQQQMAQGMEISAIARVRYGHLDGAALLAHWQPLAAQLVDALAALDPKARLPWYGPPMSARSFATARLMETWAHGQDIWDTLRLRRRNSARLRHIAHLGVSTFGWSFANRKLPVPAALPYVELTPPESSASAPWCWGDDAAPEYVRGPAEDFCLLVTQRRNLADTALRYSGGAAAQWLQIAQCFAGPPADAPPAGLRRTPD